MRHLLDIFDEGPMLIFILVSIGLTFLFFYLVIKAGVEARQKETVKMLQILINIKAEEMKHAGISKEAILEAAGQVEKLKNYEKQVEEGRITTAYLENIKNVEARI